MIGATLGAHRIDRELGPGGMGRIDVATPTPTLPWEPGRPPSPVSACSTGKPTAPAGGGPVRRGAAAPGGRDRRVS